MPLPMPRSWGALAVEGSGSGRRELLSDHLESRECARAERGHDRDVGGVAPARHQDATDAPLVVTGIERVPAATDIGFEPAAEIHRRILGWHADVPQIAGAVARRNIHAAAQRDRKVGKVAAHAASLGMGVPCCFGRARVLVTERDAIVDLV